ncbi:MAG TPA: mandelate racemase/muconate lactonizing enzyme family protein [Planctomycetes bacterium]|nr:mandelate racemase/muconate lactonizing enzyme family protein [Planctomycetota bacterium]
MLNRRKFLSVAGAASAVGILGEMPKVAAAVPKAESELGRVKIRDVKTASVRLTYYDAHLVKVFTDSGLYGLGEAYRGSGTLDWIKTIKEEVIGEDPLQVDMLFHKMMEAGSGADARSGTLTGAIAGIESAILDLVGKILSVPVYVLLGGKFRDKLLIYHDTGSPDTVEVGPWVEEAVRSRDKYGFKSMKFDLNPFRGERWNRTLSTVDMKIWLKILEAIRKELGPDFPLAVDLHWKYNTRDALKFIQMTEHLNLWFMEDPIPPENADALARITRATKVPICTGENLYTRHTWRPFIEQQACDIIQPDVQKCGGLLETKRIADWADLYYMPMACHNLCSPVGTVASGHACAAIRSFITLESDSVELEYWSDIIKREGPFYKDGYLEVSDKAGFGIELDEKVCRKHLADYSGFFE